ncbi:MAG: spore coat protein CotJB [Clostridia bacterium]|nr:spore coat protein CotJB [Clostridia bacterium]
MEQEQMAMLQKIGEARFTCVELGLYLDTHPEDAAAMADYTCYSDKLTGLISAYEESYGPLLNFGQCNMEAGSWVHSPWPWENV